MTDKVIVHETRRTLFPVKISGLAETTLSHSPVLLAEFSHKSFDTSPGLILAVPENQIQRSAVAL